MKIRADFCNGDFVHLGFDSILYYRRRLITPKSFGYQTTLIKRDSTQIEFGPMYLSIRAAVNAVIEQHKVDARTALQLFYPKLKEYPKDAPEGLEVVARGICPVTGQDLVQFKALGDIIFDHPHHVDNAERAYKVTAGSVSGWMPEECGSRYCWVDGTSSMSGTANNVLVTNHSRVIGSRAKVSWIRNSVVSHSEVIGSIVQKSDLKDCHLMDCGVRKTTIEEVSALDTSMNSCTFGLGQFGNTRAASSSANNVVALSSIVTDLDGASVHLVSSKVEDCRIYSSFVKYHDLTGVNLFESNLVSDKPISLAQDLILHDKVRVHLLVSENIKVTVT